jgi:hypothetical protein
MAESYEKFFKYSNFLVIYIISFVLMYNSNLELLGLGLGIAINIVSQLFLLVDVISSPKSSDPVIFILLIGIIGMFISSVMFLMTLVNLHSKYSLKGSPIKLTKENREKFDVYKILFITNALAIGIIAFLYFAAYKVDIANPGKMSYLLKYNFEESGDFYVPFYNFTFNPEGYQFDELAMLLFKMALGAGVLGITGFMIYLTVELSKLKTDRLYIPDKEDESIPKSFPHKSNYNNFSLSGLFQNLNMNYIMNSKTILGM